MFQVDKSNWKRVTFLLPPKSEKGILHLMQQGEYDTATSFIRLAIKKSLIEHNAWDLPGDTDE